MKIHRRLTTASLLLQLAACNRPQPEGEDVALVEEGGVVPDLPCGGADLQTDDFNCGTCGNTCEVLWPDTKYAAGGCADGKCGAATWSTDFGLPPPPEVRTCEQMCALGEFACIPRGCAGMTAYVCANLGDFGNQCDLSEPPHEALIDLTGECNQPIPYPNNVESGTFVNFACCCERP